MLRPGGRRADQASRLTGIHSRVASLAVSSAAGALLRAGRPALIREDLRGCQSPVPQPPGNPGTADLGGQLRGRDEHDRAARPRHAIADNPAAGRAAARYPAGW